MWNAKGGADRAPADLDQAIRLDPKLARAYYVRGAVRQRTGDDEGCVADLTEAARLDPK